MSIRSRAVLALNVVGEPCIERHTHAQAGDERGTYATHSHSEIEIAAISPGPDDVCRNTRKRVRGRHGWAIHASLLGLRPCERTRCVKKKKVVNA